MKILVINAGSSSLKYQLLDMETEKVIAKGNCERIGLDAPVISYKHNGQEKKFDGASTHDEAVEKLLAILTNPEYGCIKSLDEVEAVGHRVVQGGWLFKESTLVTDESVERLKKLDELAPLHNPANVKGALACRKAMPNIPHVFIFDTAFHSTMPAKAYMYAIDYKDYEEFNVRKYGAHGSSHRFITNEMANILGKKVEDVNLIICHLGNGSSITAVKNGQSVDTSMGLTPLQGVVMGTRAGDVDATVVSFLGKKKGMSAEQVVDYLNKKCGLLGVSGVSSDQRDVIAKANEGDARSQLALDMLAYSVRKYIGSYMAVLNHVDAVVFTGGIGENGDETREAIASDLDGLGIVLDKEKNTNFKRGEVELISADDSQVKIYIVPTNEELMMARDTQEIAKNLKNSK
ncbi:MAG: acetate kinase [Clostridia bacterium]|nr:acetate kinase [Clostridia bacterium]